MIMLMLVPAAAAIFVLSEPMVRLVYQRGDFTAEQTPTRRDALFWFAFSLPVQRALPADDPHLLQPPAPVDADRDLGLNLVITAVGAAALLQAVRDRRHRRRQPAFATIASVIAQA